MQNKNSAKILSHGDLSKPILHIQLLNKDLLRQGNNTKKPRDDPFELEKFTFDAIYIEGFGLMLCMR